MIRAALKYLNDLGFSVIPVRPMDKKPNLIKWDAYKDRKPTEDEIRSWWAKWPTANVGIVTGKVSGISVIDIDTQEAEEALFQIIPETITTPTETTPRGGKHLFFAYDQRIPSVASKVFKGVDTKSDGGMVVVAPSIRPEGKYAWIEGLKPGQVEFDSFPEAYIALLEKAAQEVRQAPTEGMIDVEGMFEHGRRDDSLFHVANKMAQSRTPEGEIRQVLKHLVMSWGENPDPKWINAKVESAMKRMAGRDRDINAEVRQWCVLQDGIFRVDNCFRELEYEGKDQKAECRKVLLELAKQGIVERGKGVGVYRPMNKNIEHIEIPDHESPAVPLDFPLKIEMIAQVRQRNIVIVAGTSNSGKTALCLNIAMKNMDNHRIRYQSSEMTGDELFVKLKNMPRELQDFRDKVEWINRASDWWDIVIPDAVNIIDFMEIYDNFYEIGGWIKKIHDRLTTGVAIIALQKRDDKTDTGRGGAITKEKARLYLSMDYGKLTIVKAKHWAQDFVDPNGCSVDFRLEKGINFKAVDIWRPK